MEYAENLKPGGLNCKNEFTRGGQLSGHISPKKSNKAVQAGPAGGSHKKKQNHHKDRKSDLSKNGARRGLLYNQNNAGEDAHGSPMAQQTKYQMLQQRRANKTAKTRDQKGNYWNRRHRLEMTRDYVYYLFIFI